ncbi:hypothetical protein IE53DRAFT_165278 [Violaceomyces palustris]|uniref:Uncharacterized protein n=1 Tax=Violaceomyces palustris TaxID=1673888 RepID=A0ACD0P692_9BASI|nr:hypothetical protein IE53DRAFT_165278 [Violaceomyces palustris]
MVRNVYFGKCPNPSTFLLPPPLSHRAMMKKAWLKFPNQSLPSLGSCHTTLPIGTRYSLSTFFFSSFFWVATTCRRPCFVFHFGSDRSASFSFSNFKFVRTCFRHGRRSARLARQILPVSPLLDFSPLVPSNKVKTLSHPLKLKGGETVVKQRSDPDSRKRPQGLEVVIGG